MPKIYANSLTIGPKALFALNLNNIQGLITLFRFFIIKERWRVKSPELSCLISLETYFQLEERLTISFQCEEDYVENSYTKLNHKIDQLIHADFNLFTNFFIDMEDLAFFKAFIMQYSFISSGTDFDELEREIDQYERKLIQSILDREELFSYYFKAPAKDFDPLEDEMLRHDVLIFQRTMPQYCAMLDKKHLEGPLQEEILTIIVMALFIGPEAFLSSIDRQKYSYKKKYENMPNFSASLCDFFEVIRTPESAIETRIKTESSAFIKLLITAHHALRPLSFYNAHFPFYFKENLKDEAKVFYLNLYNKVQRMVAHQTSLASTRSYYRFYQDNHKKRSTKSLQFSNEQDSINTSKAVSVTTEEKANNGVFNFKK